MRSEGNSTRAMSWGYKEIMIGQREILSKPDRQNAITIQKFMVTKFLSKI